MLAFHLCVQDSIPELKVDVVYCWFSPCQFDLDEKRRFVIIGTFSGVSSTNEVVIFIVVIVIIFRHFENLLFNALRW